MERFFGHLLHRLKPFLAACTSARALSYPHSVLCPCGACSAFTGAFLSITQNCIPLIAQNSRYLAYSSSYV